MWEGERREMLNDFLPANSGLPRRFPYRVWLQSYTASQLIDIFLGALADALSVNASITQVCLIRK